MQDEIERGEREQAIYLQTIKRKEQASEGMKPKKRNAQQELISTEDRLI